MKSGGRHLWILILMALGGACASVGAGEAGTGRNPNLISAEEIEASTATNVFELVQSLRPNWLRERGAQSIRPGGTEGEARIEHGETMVYLNQARVGGLSELRNIPMGGITSVQFIDPASATQRWGTGHSYGAIVVSTAAVRPR